MHGKPEEQSAPRESEALRGKMGEFSLFEGTQWQHELTNHSHTVYTPENEHGPGSNGTQ